MFGLNKHQEGRTRPWKLNRRTKQKRCCVFARRCRPRWWMVSLWIDKSHGTALTELADGRVGSSTITQSVAVMEAEAGVNGACLATFVMSTPTLCYRAT